MIHIRHRRHSALPLALALFLASPSGAADKPGTLSDLSLEDLMQVEVTSVSKKPQRLANVAASLQDFTVMIEKLAKTRVKAPGAPAQA